MVNVTYGMHLDSYKGVMRDRQFKPCRKRTKPSTNLTSPLSISLRDHNSTSQISTAT